MIEIAVLVLGVIAFVEAYLASKIRRHTLMVVSGMAVVLVVTVIAIRQLELAAGMPFFKQGIYSTKCVPAWVIVGTLAGAESFVAYKLIKNLETLKKAVAQSVVLPSANQSYLRREKKKAKLEKKRRKG